MKLWDILIPAIMLFYGFRMWQNPPAFGGGKGFSTQYTIKSKKAWEEGHRYLGKLMMLFGVIIGALSVVQRKVVPDQGYVWLYLVFMAINLVLICLLMPLTNRYLKKKFGFDD